MQANLTIIKNAQSSEKASNITEVSTEGYPDFTILGRYLARIGLG